MGLPEQEPDGSERRIAPRQRVLKRAKIIFNNGFSTFDCVVRNVSATGALLTLAESAHMPKEFQIKIGEEPVRPARLVYRRTMFAGVRYSDIPDEDEERSSLDQHAPSPSPSKPSLVQTGGHEAEGEPETNADTILKIKSERFPLAVTSRLAWKL